MNVNVKMMVGCVVRGESDIVDIAELLRMTCALRTYECTNIESQ